MAFTNKRQCPREALVKETLPFGATKVVSLRSIMRDVVLVLDPQKTSDAAVNKLLADAFSAKSTGMLKFESDEELKRMSFLFRRWLKFERARKGVVLARDVSNSFTFAGATKSCTFHWLLDCGDHVEAIRVKYKSPEYSPNARTPEGRPGGAAELLFLQRAGEAEALKMGIDPLKKPVFGAVYYLKNRNDTASSLVSAFEETAGSNIIVHCFTKGEAAEVEKRYAVIAPNVSKTCDLKDCRDCLYNDLCHLEFKKRHLMERPPIELKTIDNIQLTDAQLAFVSFKNGECRVNAVAGSGKTTIVTLRTLALIEDGVDPSHILMLTFSEKARDEMTVRLHSFAEGKIMSGVDLDVSAINVETFNSWGQHMLDQYYSLLGFTAKPCLVDDVQKKDIIVDLLSSHRSFPLDYRNPFMSTRAAEGAVMKMCKWIDAMKAAHVETEDDVGAAIGISQVYRKELLEVYQEYNRRLLAINAIDYEDQLRLLLKLADHGIFEKMPYEHIVVDEFQDSNPNQIAIIVELKKRNKGVKSLVVVGDELQAIYGFRNATPDNLVDFSKYFPNMVDIDMTGNFRSQQPIIQLANKIIRQTARLGKVIEAHKKSSSVKPAVIEIPSDDYEEQLFTRQVVKWLKRDHIKPNTIAVICRTRNELIKLQMALDKAGVPTILKVPEIVADAPYVKAIIAFASFLKDNNDMASLALYAKSMGQDPFDETALKATAEAILKAFAGCRNEGDKVTAFLQFLDDASEDYVAAAFLDQLKSFGFRSLYQYISYCIKYRDYKIKDSMSTAAEATDCVTLITTHSAKGLEWDHVLLSLKRFPVDEESRRLFYVGVTRAREMLLLTYTQKQGVLADMLK